MPFNPKSKANLIRFKPGQSGNPKGQPKKILRRINEDLAKEGYEQASGTQVVEAYNILINLTEARIKAIISDIDSPMFLRIVAKEMLSKGGPEMIERMLDRAHGKAITKVAATNAAGEDVNFRIIALDPLNLVDDKCNDGTT